MVFNPDNCDVIHITKQKRPILYEYKLHGHTIQSTKNVSFKNKENIHKKEGGWVIPLFWLFSDPIRSGKKS